MRTFFKILVSVVFTFSVWLPVNAKVIVKEKTSYYTVTGDSGRAIKKSIRKNRIRGLKNSNQIGVTHTKLTAKNIVSIYGGGKCKIKSTDVVLDILYILPKWRKSNLASKQLTKNWNDFSIAVTAHEKTHGKIWKETYKELHRKISKLSFKGVSHCRIFKSKTRRLLRSAEKKGDRSNKKFELSERKNSSAISRAYLKLVATK